MSLNRKYFVGVQKKPTTGKDQESDGQQKTSKHQVDKTKRKTPSQVGVEKNEGCAGRIGRVGGQLLMQKVCRWNYVPSKLTSAGCVFYSLASSSQ